MRFPPSFLDDVRARLPISQVVGRRVSWDKRKSNPGRGDFWACCPFHGEKSPSFHAEDRKGRYHCFGCGVSGDHFTFLVEAEGLSFPQAVEQLAAEAGVPMPARDAQSEAREAERASLYDVMEAAAKFFETQLHEADGAKARAYLRDRGLVQDVQKRFRLGYAPASRKALKEYLGARGIAAEQMVEAGLLVAGDDIPLPFDRFRDRIMFPILDGRGRVIAFGGRALAADAQAKYLNSPETPLFHKGSVLYNGGSARAAARKGGHVVVVEGYIDVIACVAAGFEATVAPLGTALTEDQLQLLWGMTDEPILCFDGDEAGLKAAFRAIDVALPYLLPGKSIKFALIPNNQDPDDMIRGEGAEAFERVLADAKPLSHFLLAREMQAVNLTVPEQRAAFEAKLYEIAGSIRNSTVARHYRDFFRLRMSEIFWSSDGKKKIAEVKNIRSAPKSILENILVGICVEEPALFRDHYEDLLSLEFENNNYTKFLDKMYELLVAYESLSVRLIYERLGSEFFAVLQETHGRPQNMISEVREDGPQFSPMPSSGERLRLLLPVMRRSPPLEAIRQMLAHFILLQRQKGYQAEVERRLKEYSDAGTLDAHLAALSEFRNMVAESEKELDSALERLRFRPANDNSLGTIVLSGEKNDWKQVLRAVR